jgi:anti-sigma B factor antagonist
MKNKDFTLEHLPGSIIIKFNMKELDLMSSPKIASDIESAVKDIRETSLIIDIDRLDYIDSTGISLVFSIIKECAKKEVSVSIICRNDTIKKLFGMFNMDFSYTFYSSIEEVNAETY